MSHQPLSCVCVFMSVLVCAYVCVGVQMTVRLCVDICNLAGVQVGFLCVRVSVFKPLLCHFSYFNICSLSALTALGMWFKWVLLFLIL